MSILLLQGPGTASADPGGRIVAALWRTAHRCGHRLRCQASTSIASLVDCLRGRLCGTSDLVLLNPGKLGLPPGSAVESLRDALDRLPVPYIEIHACGGQLLELDLRSSQQPIATIAIAGDFDASCRIAMGVAVRHLSLRARPT